MAISKVIIHLVDILLIKAMVNIAKAGPKELRGANMRSRKVLM